MLSTTIRYFLLAFVIVMSDICCGDSPISQSDLYLDIQVPNYSAILRKIASIPLKFYEFKFDSIAGRRQMGFFGAEVMSAFPESVEIAPKYTLPNRDKSKPATVLLDYPLVDKSVVFMHSIAAIQELQKCYTILADAVNLCASDELKVFWAVEAMLATTGKDRSWQPSINLKLLNEISLPKTDLAEVLIEKTLRASALRKSHATYRKSLREEFHQLHHHWVGNTSADTVSKLEDISISKIKYLSELKDLALQKQYDEDVSQLDSDFNESIGQYATSIDQVSYLVKFKIKMQQEAQDEEHDIALMKARDEVMRKEIMFVIDVFFGELSSTISKMNISPSLFLFRGLLGLLVCLALTVAYEVGKVAKLHLFRKLFTLPDPSARALVKRGDPRKDEAGLRDLIHGVDVMCSLDNFNSNLRSSLRNKLPLPNLLLFGQSGTGKTLSASAIAAASGASSVIVTGSELLSKGNNAGSSFRILLDSARKSSNSPVIVILDDADAIVKSRDTERRDNTGSNSSSAVHCCFFLLLESIRESHLGMSVIITTSSEHISCIDSALLDRLDAVVELSLPDPEQRLTFIAKRSLDLLSPFFSAAAKTALEGCLSYELRPRRASTPPSTKEQVTSQEVVRGHLDSIALIDATSSSVPLLSAEDPYFDVTSCVYTLAARSRLWSLKDIAKLLVNVRSEVLGTERCTLTSYIWMREIGRKMKEIAVL